MTDEELSALMQELGDHASFEPHMHHTAADRIEALITERDEAMQLLQTLSNMNGDLSRDIYKTKLLLAKAADVIDWVLICWDDHNKHGYDMQGDWVSDARTTLAEIKSGVATTPYGLEGESHE